MYYLLVNIFANLTVYDKSQVYYQDETWANEHHSRKRGWHMPKNQILGNIITSKRKDIWQKGVGKRFSDGMIGKKANVLR